MVKQHGGEFTGGMDHGTPVAPVTPMTGGKRRRRSSKKGGKRSYRKRHSKRGGDGGVIATAAVPFGLLALQRFFKGSKTSKRGLQKMGKSFKRTFRRRR